MEKVVDSERKQGILRVIHSLETGFNATPQEIIDLILSEASSHVPVEIFSDRSLSSLQALVKFLIENRGLTNVQVARLLNRDTRTIWTTYSFAKRLKKDRFAFKSSEILVPVSLFKDRGLSVLEHIAWFLKSLGNSNHKIALLLKRSDTTISTVLKRANVKNEKK